MGARLIIDKGPLSGFVLVLEQGTSWSIGKDAASSDIQLEDPKLANTQVVITREDDFYFITNLDTSYPVTVNGKEITEATPIHD
ncbi:FHA domain protein, partial [Chlamydia psittaci 06-1683]